MAFVRSNNDAAVFSYLLFRWRWRRQQPTLFDMKKILDSKVSLLSHALALSSQRRVLVDEERWSLA